MKRGWWYGMGVKLPHAIPAPHMDGRLISQLLHFCPRSPLGAWKKQGNSPSILGPATHVEDLKEAPSSCVWFGPPLTVVAISLVSPLLPSSFNL